jgi:hypothetical protein
MPVRNVFGGSFVILFQHCHRSGADDRHRHHHQRLPGGVQGVPMAAPADVDEKPKRRRLLGWFARRGGKNKPTPAPAPALALAPAN